MDLTSFGRYRVISLIGEGGMGKVYKAHDTVIGRDVALKVLPTELGSQPGYRERFRREAQTAARLTEPHIIPIHDTGEIDGHLYLVMPVIDGIDVHSLLQRDGPMQPEQAVHVIEQLAAALSAAHENGLVHRDIKPSNALMTNHNFVYLIDFGIAHDSAATRLTSTGMMVGTLAYMAPERFGTGSADARADVYSLTCVLFECLTGATPFRGDSVEQQIAGHLTQPAPKPSKTNPAVGTPFDDVIATGLAKNPNDRYQSARDLAVAARRALTGPSARQNWAAPPQLPPIPTPPANPTLAASQPSAPGWPPGPPPAFSAPAPRRSAPSWPVLFMIVVGVAIAITMVAYLIVKPNPKSVNTAQVPTTTQQVAAVTQSSAIPQPVSSASPSTVAEVAGLTPFVGVWQAHQATLTVRSDGTGHVTYANLAACPSCSSADAPLGTADFTLTSVANGVATGNVTASNDEQIIAVGSPATATLASGIPSGTTLEISMGKMDRFFCNDTSPGQCGA